MIDELKIPLFLALDVDDGVKALAMAKNLQSFVGGFKIGPRLTIKYGNEFIQELAKMGPVFVDSKYYDIPSTMEFAVRATFEAGAHYTTIHASSGREALERMGRVEKELNRKRPFKILVVTVLTSHSNNNLPIHWKDVAVENHVATLAAEAVDAGLSGVVCSSHEVQKLREKNPKAFLVTPGIRFMNEGKADQCRVSGPVEALENGSSALVVGRPICDAEDPILAAKSYYSAIVHR